MAETTVTTFAALRTAAQDPNIDYIHVNADLNYDSSGVLIYKNKPSLVIDCKDTVTGENHTLTDYNNLSIGSAIRVEINSAPFHLTLKNCTFVGRNYYGALAADNSAYQYDTLLTLENVDYSGPQASYNRYGTVEYIGGSYLVGNYNGTQATVGHEFVEANRVILAGNLTVQHTSTGNSCCYICEANPKLTIRAGANVTFTNQTRELVYNDVVGMDFTMEDGARLNVTSPRNMFYSSSMTANFISIGKNAEFVYNQTAARGGYATVLCRGNMTVGEGSRFIIIKKDYTSTDPLIQFSATSTATFDNPSSVVLYNQNGRVINWSSGTGTLIVRTQILNYWATARPFPTAGTFADIPDYNWTKADDTVFETSATVTSTTTTNVTTTLIQGVDAPIIPNNTTFNIQSARVLSLGQLDLEVIPPHQGDALVQGITNSAATVRTEINAVQTYGTVDYFGTYTVLIDPPLNKNDVVTVGSNFDFKIMYVTYAAAGIITMDVPTELPFIRVAVPFVRTIFPRKQTDWQIVVNDSRDDGMDWNIYAELQTPLMNVHSETLDDALIFKEDENISVLNTVVRVLVYEGTANTDPEYTTTIISWDKVNGMLMQLNPALTYRAGEYRGAVRFILEEEE